MTHPLKPEHWICPECGYRPLFSGVCQVCDVEYVNDPRSRVERYNEIHADDEDEGDIYE